MPPAFSWVEGWVTRASLWEFSGWGSLTSSAQIPRAAKITITSGTLTCPTDRMRHKSQAIFKGRWGLVTSFSQPTHESGVPCVVVPFSRCEY